MVQVLEELKYTNDHEWAHVEGDVLVMGITDYAQDSQFILSFRAKETKSPKATLLGQLSRQKPSLISMLQ